MGRVYFAQHRQPKIAAAMYDVCVSNRPQLRACRKRWAAIGPMQYKKAAAENRKETQARTQY